MSVQQLPRRLFQNSDDQIEYAAFAFHNVTSGDTAALAPYFSAIKFVTAICTTNPALGVSTPTINGTTITFGAAFAGDSVVVLVTGEAP